MDEDVKFIGTEALQEVATKVGTQIIMGPAYSAANVISRMQIDVLSGIRFKAVDTVLVRKGGTTRRKVVGDKLHSSIGFLKERKLEVQLSWNVFHDNIDNYNETIFSADGRPGGSYPLSTEACEAILKTYAEDLTDNLFFGNIDIEDAQKQYLTLYNGFHTNIALDIEAGIISPLNGNMVECESIEAPVDADDTEAYDIVLGVYLKADRRLQNAPVVLCYCDVFRGIYIAQAYKNKNRGHQGVIYATDGTYRIPEMPNVIFVPEAAFGVGDRIIFTVPKNFQYGVDTRSNQSFVKVKVGSDNDLQDVMFQIQSKQGTRVKNPLPSAFCMTNGAISENSAAGDYRNSLVSVNFNSTECASVTVNGTAYEKPKEYAPNTVLSFKAVANEGYVFDRWSNGSKDNPMSLVATGLPMAIVPIFKKS